MSSTSPAPTLAAPRGAFATLIERTPPGAFAMVMGLAGLSLAWQRAALVLDTGPVAGVIFATLALLAFIVLLLLYGAKVLRFPQRVREELVHPVKSAFLATLSIGFVLLATVFLSRAPALAEVLLWIGALAHLAVTLRLLSWWMGHPELDPKSVTPAWIIAPVGNLLVATPAMRLGYADAAWFFFSVGITLWLPMLAIVLWRLYFGGTLPPRLQPTLAILLAPPAVAFLALTTLLGAPNVPALMLFYFALFVLMLLATQLPAFVKLPFFISSWAFSFPLAAMTTATLVLLQATRASWLLPLAVALLGVATLVISGLFLRTLLALVRRESNWVD